MTKDFYEYVMTKTAVLMQDMDELEYPIDFISFVLQGIHEKVARATDAGITVIVEENPVNLS